MSSAKTKHEEYVSDETFAEIEGAFKEALEHARGTRTDLRTMRVALPPPPKKMNHTEIAKLRARFNYSQSVFARLLNVSTKTIQAWEQGLREPSDAALKLLAIAAKHPEVLLDS
jgi:putative transcriptional regulator